VSVDPVAFTTISADGAITLANGVVFVSKAGVCAMTIDNPPSEGVHELTIISTTAQAHTLTYSAGFGGGTTSRDVATFGGAISDNIQLVSLAGLWYVKSTRNVTLA
jgi:hypothetical protein